jgi:hypothetical protein
MRIFSKKAKGKENKFFGLVLVQKKKNIPRGSAARI